MTPEEAYHHALEHGPSDDTRAVACQDPGWAWLYAVDVDKAPRPDTRAVACQGPGYAYVYAKVVDQAPHPDTRAAVAGTRWQAAYEGYFS